MNRLLYILVICLTSASMHAQIYRTNFGTAKFTSDAPLERIEAESDQLKGVLDVDKKTYAFKIFIKSFKGFNSPLQQEHFYENYMEVRSFPESVFRGKILEDIDLENEGQYRAKGVLSMHGLSNEIIVEVELRPEEDEFHFSSTFEVRIKDYEIDLPRIVHQKISEVIQVEVFGKLSLLE